MGIIRTDQWLEKDFDRPIKICERLLPYFKGQKANEIYNQLQNFGMYRPSWKSRNNVSEMKEYNAWDRVEELFNIYVKKWSGPNIPIFLFPLNERGGLFIRRDERRKAGVSFPDKMFLFLSSYEDLKEVEALFVHEYHHVCRLRALNKDFKEYTLLDSLIIEGLAEYAVYKHCGKEYLANWCRMYTDREISYFWDRYIKKQLDISKNQKLHDELLYGGGRFPLLLGYAAGYNIIRKFYEKQNYSTKLSFTQPASKYLKENIDFSR